MLKTLDSCVVCIGYQVLSLVKSHKGLFMDATGKTWCVCDGTDIIIVSFLSLHIGTCVTALADASTNPPTICHARCAQLLTEGEMKHCGACTSYRKTLHAMLSRRRSSSASKIAPDSHVNYHDLSTPEKVDRLTCLHTLQRQTAHRLHRLKAKIEQDVEEKGVEVDEATHNDLVEITKESSAMVSDAHPMDSFQKLFWEQQHKDLYISGICQGEHMRCYEKVGALCCPLSEH